MRSLNWFLLCVVVILLAVGFYCTCVQSPSVSTPVSSARPATPTDSPTPTSPSSAVTSVPVDDNDPLGLPVAHGRQLQVLHKPHFTIGYDNERREPAWVSYALAGPIQFHGKEHRPEKFADDPDVTAPAHHADYSRSGFDRGHMCPAYAMFSRFGPEGMAETFITSNIVPQVHGLNAGRWEDLEAMISGREGKGDGWAGRYGEVWVTDGPVHVEAEATIPGGEPEPAACFMIVLRKDGQSWTSLAFEMPNRLLCEPVAEFLVSIRKLEHDTGLDFDGALPTAQQDAMEIATASDLWRCGLTQEHFHRPGKSLSLAGDVACNLLMPPPQPVNLGSHSDGGIDDMSGDNESDDLPEGDDEAGPDAAPATKKSARRKVVTPGRLDPQVAAGLGRCLRARLDRLDRDIAHAKDIAVTQLFYTHWAEHLVKVRTEAAKHLTEFEGDASVER